MFAHTLAMCYYEPMPSTFSQPELELPLQIIRQDLKRTLIVMCGGLLFQTGLYIYLRHGGWNTILQLLHSISL